MPAAANFSDCQVSMKNPRASPNTWGSISTAPWIGVFVNFIASAASRLRSLAHDALEVLAVAALRERLGELEQTIGIDEAVAPGDLLHAGHLQSLPLLDDAHEHTGVEQ